MIVITTDRCEGAQVVHIEGAFDAADDPVSLVAHLSRAVGEQPLVLDLAGLDPATGPKVEMLLAALAHAPTRAATVLVHPDLTTRRALRASSDGLPVVPSNDLVLHGRFAAAIAANAGPDPS